ncbi:universal stress protein [Edaphobacter paludis]|uniref:Universal stress protein n=1 Tax=Edaphobacter paludis TaxID=3035702 RepID=A0AAU7D457_9BACT
MPSTIKSPFHVILFATDLSDHSAAALRYAASVATAYGAKLFLVHVLDPDITPTDSSPSDLRNLAQSAMSELKGICQSLLATHGITAQAIVRYGNVRDVIFQVQQECSADIVVLGSSGKKISRGNTLGSTAEAVLRSMPCNVLTIGPHIEWHPFSTKAQAILFPTDLSADSLAALPTAVSMATSLSARLLLLHVCDPYELHSCFGGEVDCKKKLREVAASTETQELRVEYSAEEGRIAERTLSFAKEKHVDLIVMAIHQGNLDDGTRLHGIVSDIVRESQCPVFTVARHVDASLAPPQGTSK